MGLRLQVVKRAFQIGLIPPPLPSAHRLMRLQLCSGRMPKTDMAAPLRARRAGTVAHRHQRIAERENRWGSDAFESIEYTQKRPCRGAVGDIERWKCEKMPSISTVIRREIRSWRCGRSSSRLTCVAGRPRGGIMACGQSAVSRATGSNRCRWRWRLRCRRSASELP